MAEQAEAEAVAANPQVKGPARSGAQRASILASGAVTASSTTHRAHAPTRRPRPAKPEMKGARQCLP